ncbi:MAG: O-antigen ligase family protein [Holosporales bacterium]|jgi:O-antigen ligase|nr:O-antigen ligase family protein [Holosporales bacterium]
MQCLRPRLRALLHKARQKIPSIEADFLPYIAFIFMPCAVLSVHSLNAIAIVSILLVCAKCARRRENPLIFEQGAPLFVLYNMGVFLLWIAATCFWATDVSLSLSRTIRVLGCIIFGGFLSLSLMRETQEEKTVCFFERGLLLALCLLVFEFTSHGFIRHYILPVKGYTSESYIWGRMINTYNQQACALSIVVWPMVGHLVLRKEWNLLGLVAFLSLCVFFAAGNEGTRAAFLAGFVAFFGTWWKEKFLCFFRLVTLVGIGSAPFIITELPLDRIVAHMDQGVIEATSAYSRLCIWKHCAQRISEHPLRGHGLWSLRADKLPKAACREKKNTGQQKEEDAHVLHQHNVSLEIWQDLGSVGMLLFLFLLNSLFQTLQKASIPTFLKSGFCASLSAALAMTTVCFSFWQSWWLFFLCLVAPIIRALVVVNRHGENTS